MFINMPAPAQTGAQRPIPESYWVIAGRFLAGEYPVVAYAPQVTTRRLAALLDADFDTLVNLTADGEGEPYDERLQEQAVLCGRSVQCLHYPIADYGLPSRADMRSLLDVLDGALANQHKVYMHCYGGIGRTGTAVGCFLVRHGLSGQQALQTLAGWWQSVPKSARFPHSPETFAQEKFVLEWQEPPL